MMATHGLNALRIIAKQLVESKSSIPRAYLEVGQQLHPVCGISCLKWFLVSKLQVLLLATSSMIGC